MQQIKVSEGTAARRRIPFYAVDSADGVTAKTGLTFSGSEIRISKNGADSGNFAGSVTEVSSANFPGLYFYETTSGEVDTLGFFALRFADAAMKINVEAVQITAFDPYTSIESQVWDALASGHTTAGTYGRLLQAVRDGTAQAGAAGTITLDAGASGTNNLYNECVVRIVAGTGAGQGGRRITAYDGTTKVATITPNWTTNPSSDSVFVITGASAVSAGGSSTPFPCQPMAKREIKKGADRSIVIFMRDSTTGLGATGKTLTTTFSQNGGAFSGIVPTVVTELSNGWYKVDLTGSAGHTNTLGDLAIHATATGCFATDEVVAEIVDNIARDVVALMNENAVMDGGSGVANAVYTNGVLTSARIRVFGSAAAAAAATAGAADGAEGELYRFLITATESGGQAATYRFRRVLPA